MGAYEVPKSSRFWVHANEDIAALIHVLDALGRYEAHRPEVANMYQGDSSRMKGTIDLTEATFREMKAAKATQGLDEQESGLRRSMSAAGAAGEDRHDEHNKDVFKIHKLH